MNPTKFNLNSNLDKEPVGLLLVDQPSLITTNKIFKLVHGKYEQTFFFLIHVGCSGQFAYTSTNPRRS